MVVEVGDAVHGIYHKEDLVGLLDSKLHLLVDLSSKISSELTTHPPVSTIEKSLPFQPTRPYCLSRVVPAVGSTMAVRVWVRRLKRVDFPTLGRPTMAIICPISVVESVKQQSYEKKMTHAE